MTNFSFIISGLLLLSASSSIAMSLGRHSGAVLIGKPLDMSVQAVMDAQEDVSGACVEADVFYADNKLDKSRVRVTVEKSASAPQQATIRIRSAVLIDEPIVTLYLRVGCQLKSERRYVSLAELVSEVLPDRNLVGPMAPALPARPAPSRPLSSAGNVASGVPGIPASSAMPAETPPASPTKRPALVRPPKNQRGPIAVTATQAPVKARLKLEPLDLSVDRDPQLKASSELISIPAANPQERAAASALWRALSAQPQDILRDTEKLQALESSVRTLQVQGQKTQTSIDSLNAKLQQAQAERYANGLVYGLIVLLLAAIAGLVYLLRRKLLASGRESADKPWWRKNDVQQGHQQAWHDSLPPQDVYESSAARFAAEQKSALVDIEVDFDLEKASKPAGLGSLSRPSFGDSLPFDARGKSGFVSSLTHGTRAVKAEELFDVQQQADFFVSIGQHEQAIELLRSHIAEQPETSALVYLDLFNLYHQLSRPTEYDSLRAEFNQRFNTQVPSFEVYTDKNLGLEAYQLALSRIVALWPSPKVLEIIEESLFRQPDVKAEPFNLEAYRELLMLYSLAKEIIEMDAGKATPANQFDVPSDDDDDDGAYSRPMTFKATSIQPLSASVHVNSRAEQDLNTSPLVHSVIPHTSSRLGLDIDLDFLGSGPYDATGTAVATDSKYRADVEPGDFAHPPVIGRDPLVVSKPSASASNLIDFDVFDLSSEPTEKPKRPGV